MIRSDTLVFADMSKYRKEIAYEMLAKAQRDNEIGHINNPYLPGGNKRISTPTPEQRNRHPTNPTRTTTKLKGRTMANNRSRTGGRNHTNPAGRETTMTTGDAAEEETDNIGTGTKSLTDKSETMMIGQETASKGTKPNSPRLRIPRSRKGKRRYPE
jgi:hypothetical protein